MLKMSAVGRHCPHNISWKQGSFTSISYAIINHKESQARKLRPRCGSVLHESY